MKSKRIYHRIYRVESLGHVFEIDGQNREYDTKEWELYALVDNGYGTQDREWIETYPTKKAALADIPNILNK
jgi:hypothetical protein